MLIDMKMATVKLSIQDKKDLDKFTKFFALKAAQIIVQSRLGEKFHTKCKPHSSGTDWFNLAIQDIPDVLSETKKALGTGIVAAQFPLVVEISLRTVEGDTMILETWCLGVLTDQCDPSVRVTYTVYNRMGILLKSLVSVTRVTPAYKLSRRQGPDSYVICYRIYMGEPQLHNLGEGYSEVRVGQLCTPVGTLHLKVAYRTKMTISPQHTGKDSSIMVKSDHFHPDLSPKHLRYQQSEENNTSLSETIKVGAFADSSRPPPKPLESDLVIPTIPFSSLLTPRQQSPPQPSHQTTGQDNEVTGGDDGEDDGNGNITPRCNSAADSRRSSCSMVSANEDFIMKTPFAGNNANSDLGAFYRECQSAPPLKTFSEQPTLAEQVEDISKTLEAFESCIQEYDEMLNSLCLNDNNN
ncbi:autophagy-related protein 13 homolog isoform X2 [Anabrus simplex]|uniref:autophagy-related protein 13 homolog isoform X2 n=1 Tax=Anabrus simplex TaxID=316456 RepID=UPI0034DD3312